MPIPDYQTLMLPVLSSLADGKSRHHSEVEAEVSRRLALSAEDLAATIPSGTRLITNRVGWARSYLKQAGLIEYPRRGYLKITDRGGALLNEHPPKIDNSTLIRYPEFVQFMERNRSSGNGASAATAPAAQESDGGTPEEQIQLAHRTIRTQIESDLLDRVKACSPGFFERLVVRLLVAMGYGGSIEDAGQAVGQSHDGGIDGVIKEDRLGLDQILIQAKRYGDGSVGAPAVQQFVGALQGRGATKGVLLTTSTFTQTAKDYANTLRNCRVILVDGPQLASLMVDHQIGVETIMTYRIDQIDNDFFDEPDEQAASAGQRA